MKTSPDFASATPKGGAEAKQAELFSTIQDDWQQHHDDPASQRYRDEFIYGPLFQGVPLEGAEVLDAMCGNGQATGYLRSRGARVTGLDIAEAAVESFRARWTGCRGVCASMLDSGLEGASFDSVVVIGGLHHLHPDLDRGVREIARLLRPGGHFLFVEPHVGSLPDVVRKRWYKYDRLFMENEASIDAGALLDRHRDVFDRVEERYFGTVAYLFVLQSLVLRIPVGLKRYYAPALFALERLIRPLETKRFSCQVAGHWTRVGRAS